jgi:hypothetical protein
VTEPLTNGTPDAIVTFLAARHAAISNFEPEQVTYNASTWNRWLESFASESGSRRLRTVVQNQIELHKDSGISRQTLRDLAQRFDIAENRARLWVATLAWGRGRKNARLMPAWSSAWKDWRQLDGVLRHTRKLVVKGLPGEAYEGFAAAFPGIGESFFTKWLWVVGTPLPEDARFLKPLVLDNQVWDALGRLGWSSQRDSGFRRNTRPSASYCAYLGALRTWCAALTAKALPTLPEEVEHYLFECGDELA